MKIFKRNSQLISFYIYIKIINLLNINITKRKVSFDFMPKLGNLTPELINHDVRNPHDK